MTESTIRATNYPAATVADARLSLKPNGATSGYVDGAWWPGSLGLTAEIPDLVAQLADHWGRGPDVLRPGRLDSSGPASHGRWPKDPIGRIPRTPPDRRRPCLRRRPTDDHPADHPADHGSREASDILRRAGTAGNQETIGDLLHHGRSSERSVPDRPTNGAAADVGAQKRIDDADTAGLGRWDTEGGHDRRPAD